MMATETKATLTGPGYGTRAIRVSIVREWAPSPTWPRGLVRFRYGDGREAYCEPQDLSRDAKGITAQ